MEYFFVFLAFDGIFGAIYNIIAFNFAIVIAHQELNKKIEINKSVAFSYFADVCVNIDHCAISALKSNFQCSLSQ